jgi:carboxymethylenebutenolidase
MRKYIVMNTPDGGFQADVVCPDSLPTSAAVIQEIFGLNADLRATYDEIAAQEYLAISPEHLRRLELGAQTQRVCSNVRPPRL